VTGSTPDPASPQTFGRYKGVNHGKTDPNAHWEALANDAGGSRQAEGLSLLYAQRVKEAEAIAREHEL